MAHQLHMDDIAGKDAMALVSPAFLYAFSWGLVLGLYLLGATSNQVPLTRDFVVLIFAGLSVFLAALLIKSDRQPGGVFDYFAYAKACILIWLVGSLFEVVISGGLPFVWAAFPQEYEDLDYTDFGVPSLHGVCNALYLQGVSALVAGLVRDGYRKTYFRIFLLLLLWPVLMLGRGILLSALLQASVIFFMFRGNWRVLTGLALSAIAFVILFGVLGDFRGGDRPFEYLVDDAYVSVFDALPSGVLWFYVYLTGGVSNLIHNMSVSHPEFMGLTFVNLVPSFLKPYLGVGGSCGFMLVDAKINVATALICPFMDLGFIGCLLYFSVLAALATWLFRRAKSLDSGYVLAYAVFAQIVVFSVFYDMLFLLPVAFQLVLFMAARRFFVARSGVGRPL